MWADTRVQRRTLDAFGQTRGATTMRPRLAAPKELYRLGINLLHVRTLEKASAWVQAYAPRCLRWEVFLAERTTRGDGGWEYTHERLVRARNSLNRLVS